MRSMAKKGEGKNLAMITTTKQLLVIIFFIGTAVVTADIDPTAVSDGITPLSYTENTLSDGVNTLVHTVNAVSDAESTLSNAESTVSDDVHTLPDNVNAVSDGVSTTFVAESTMSDGLSTLSDNVNAVSDGVSTLSNAESTVSDGVSTLSDNVNAVSDGVSTTFVAESTMSDGLNTLSNNVGAVSDGVSTLLDDVSTVSDGVSTMSDGVSTVPGEIASGPATVSNPDDETTLKATTASATAAEGITTQGDDGNRETTTTHNMTSTETELATELTSESKIVDGRLSTDSTAIEDSATSETIHLTSTSVDETVAERTTVVEDDKESSTEVPTVHETHTKATSETQSEETATETTEVHTIHVHLDKESDKTTKSEAEKTDHEFKKTTSWPTKGETTTIDVCHNDPNCWVVIIFKNQSHQNSAFLCKKFLDIIENKRPTALKKEKSEICSESVGNEFHRRRRNADDEMQFDFRKEGQNLIALIYEPNVTRTETMNFARSIIPDLASALGIPENMIKTGLRPPPEKKKETKETTKSVEFSSSPPSKEQTPKPGSSSDPVSNPRPSIWEAHYGLFLTVIIMILVCIVIGVLCYINTKCRGNGSSTDKQYLTVEDGKRGPVDASSPFTDAEMVSDEVPCPMQEVENPAVTPNGGGLHISKTDDDNGYIVPLDQLSQAEKEKPEIENTKL